MRIISTMREAHKGGTIIVVPHERSYEFISKNPLINIKYQFKEDETRYRSLRLMLETLQTLARKKAGPKLIQAKSLIGKSTSVVTATNCLVWKKRGSNYPINWLILRWLTARSC